MQNMTQYIKTYILYIYKSIKQEVTIMVYDITGNNPMGGRRPITMGLKAGQFRQMGVPRNVSSNIFINNNFGCMGGSYNAAYFDDCCGNNDGGMSKFEKWMMGLGISGGLLGGILGAFGKGKSEGAGDTGETKTDEFAGLKELYKNEKYTFSKVGSDYCCNTGDDIITAPTIEELNKKLMGLKNKPTQAPATTAPAQQTTQAAETPAETLPKLFNDTGMNGLTTEQEVLNKFKTETKADAYKIDASSSSGITINQVNDSGNKTSMSGSIEISAEKLKGLKPNTWTSLGKFHGKDISATSLDGYLQIQVGDQTYIVGKTSDNKYQGYQFENGNVIGYSEANWHRGR